MADVNGSAAQTMPDFGASAAGAVAAPPAPCISCFQRRGVSGALTCHKSAPTSATYAAGGLDAAWPPVKDFDSCGEFAPNDPVVWRAGVSLLCSTCYYAKPDANAVLHCNKQQPNATSRQAGSQPTTWPVVQPDDSCGEWLDKSPLVWSAPPPQYSIFYPAISSPNPWDTIAFTSATDLSGIPDVTSIVQGAVDACGSTGRGGLVQLPPGVIRINGLVIGGDGVWLRGYGVGVASFPQPPIGSPALRPKFGTYLLTDNASDSAIVVTSTAKNVLISDVGFLQPQPPEAPGWTPTVFAPSILFRGPNINNSFSLSDIVFWGVYQGLSLGQGPNEGVTKVKISNVMMATFAPKAAGGGIRIYGSTDLDDVNIDGLQFIPLVMLNGNPNQQAYIASNSAAVMVSGDNRMTEVVNSLFENVGTAIGFDGNGASSVSGHQLTGIRMMSCLTGIYENVLSYPCRVTISDLTFLSATSGGVATASTKVLDTQGFLPQFMIGGLQAQYFLDSVFNVQSANATILMSPTVAIDSWNQGGGGSAALFVWYVTSSVTYSANSLFTNGGGGAVAGGAGTFHAY